MRHVQPEVLETLLKDLYFAGLKMPRHTPNLGAASTEHTYKIGAHAVWAFDSAMKKVAEEFGITHQPSECCVGSRHFDPREAAAFSEQTRNELQSG